MKSAALAVYALLIASLFFASWQEDSKSSLDLNELMNSKALLGDQGRIEREFKISIPLTESQNSREVSQQVSALIHKALVQALSEQTLWQVPLLQKNQYYLTGTHHPLFFRDIYFDTETELNQKNDLTYRLRHRWKSFESYLFYKRGLSHQDTSPHRYELQAKVGRTTGRDGLTVVQETRADLSQKVGWPIENLLMVAQTGRLKSQILAPSRAYVQFLKDQGLLKQLNENEIRLRPTVIVSTNRTRFHLNIPSKWGSGPNPEHTFIITVDHFSSSKTPSRMTENNLSNPQDHFRKKSVIELEIEFERNTSTRIEITLESSPTDYQALKAQKAYMADLNTLKKVVLSNVRAEFPQAGVSQKSKYQQALELMSDF